jgi:hypothetical protein
MNKEVGHFVYLVRPRNYRGTMVDVAVGCRERLRKSDEEAYK